jgi:hypothetical protein
MNSQKFPYSETKKFIYFSWNVVSLPFLKTNITHLSPRLYHNCAIKGGGIRLIYWGYLSGINDTNISITIHSLGEYIFKSDLHGYTAGPRQNSVLLLLDGLGIHRFIVK